MGMGVLEVRKLFRRDFQQEVSSELGGGELKLRQEVSKRGWHKLRYLDGTEMSRWASLSQAFAHCRGAESFQRGNFSSFF